MLSEIDVNGATDDSSAGSSLTMGQSTKKRVQRIEQTLPY